MLLRRRAVLQNLSDLTGSRFEPQTSHSRDQRVTARLMNLKHSFCGSTYTMLTEMLQKVFKKMLSYSSRIFKLFTFCHFQNIAVKSLPLNRHCTSAFAFCQHCDIRDANCGTCGKKAPAPELQFFDVWLRLRIIVTSQSSDRFVPVVHLVKSTDDRRANRVLMRGRGLNPNLKFAWVIQHFIVMGLGVKPCAATIFKRC